MAIGAMTKNKERGGRTPRWKELRELWGKSRYARRKTVRDGKEREKEDRKRTC